MNVLAIFYYKQAIALFYWILFRVKVNNLCNGLFYVKFFSINDKIKKFIGSNYIIKDDKIRIF